MTMPSIPEREQQQALTDLLVSIALEEVSLAHYMNAEAEKVQEIAKKLKKGDICVQQAIELQESVIKAMRLPIKNQMLLQFKLEDILEAKEKFEFNDDNGDDDDCDDCDDCDD